MLPFDPGKLGITRLNPMQLATLEAARANSNLILLSPTGSGKTLAFLLPLLEKLEKDIPGVQALILVPSRELALQIEQVFRQMGTGFKVNCCYGGHPVRQEKNNLAHPPAVLIGTPGRIAWHIRNLTFDPGSVRTLVLDEFDKSLEFGFQDDMAFIIGGLPALQNRFLISATGLESIPAFTGVSQPVELNFLQEEEAGPPRLQTRYLRAPGTDKLQLLLELLCSLGNQPVLVFCNHRDAVERIGALLAGHGLIHGVFHGGMDQEDREETLIRFRNGSCTRLITTDLASRGLDIPEIAAVVHYQLPATAEVYLHRNGRTARMKAEGTAWLMLSESDRFPDFLIETPEEGHLPDQRVFPPASFWKTLCLKAGKKDKFSKTDVVGALLRLGGMEKDDLGRVDVLDHLSFAAVRREKADSLSEILNQNKIKGRKIRVWFCD